MKITASILIIAVCVLIGRSYIRRLCERELILEQVCAFIRALVSGIRYGKKPLADIIISQAPSCGRLLSRCAELIFSGADFHEAWQNSINAETLGAMLGKRELDDLASLGEELGRSDVQSQLELLEEYGERFNETLEETKKENAKKKKLGSSISWLAGIFIAIILI